MLDEYPEILSGVARDDGDYEANRDLSPDEIEVRLAIADYVIRRVNGTADGREIFNALIKRYENKFPHHKVLAHCLTSPGHIEPEEIENF